MQRRYDVTDGFILLHASVVNVSSIRIDAIDKALFQVFDLTIKKFKFSSSNFMLRQDAKMIRLTFRF